MKVVLIHGRVVRGNPCDEEETTPEAPRDNGTTLGAAATIVFATHHGWPVIVPPAVTGAVIAGSVVVGILAGGYPAMRAARLSPTEALSTS
jgi:hypothetical protein